MKTVDDNDGDDALKLDSKVFDGCETNLAQLVPLQIESWIYSHEKKPRKISNLLNH